MSNIILNLKQIVFFLLVMGMLLVSVSGCGYWRQTAAPVESGRSAKVSVQDNVEDNNSIGGAIVSPTSESGVVKPVVSAAVRECKEHIVQRGETLYRIAKTYGLKYQDIAAWNNIQDSNIRIGQVLRLAPSGSQSIVSEKVRKPAMGKSEEATSKDVVSEDSSIVNKGGEAAAKDNYVDGILWAWPTEGKIARNFSESSKGVDIAGNIGQSIYSAADGTVAYSGSGLRGYGKLILIKHNKEFLTAYAHNNTLLVKEGEIVKKGQKIAEMGRTDANQVKLHFEVRRFGKPVDPAKYLK